MKYCRREIGTVSVFFTLFCSIYQTRPGHASSSHTHYFKPLARARPDKATSYFTMLYTECLFPHKHPIIKNIETSWMYGHSKDYLPHLPGVVKVYHSR